MRKLRRAAKAAKSAVAPFSGAGMPGRIPAVLSGA